MQSFGEQHAAELIEAMAPGLDCNAPVALSDYLLEPLCAKACVAWWAWRIPSAKLSVFLRGIFALKSSSTQSEVLDAIGNSNQHGRIWRGNATSSSEKGTFLRSNQHGRTREHPPFENCLKKCISQGPL